MRVADHMRRNFYTEKRAVSPLSKPALTKAPRYAPKNSTVTTVPAPSSL